MISKNSKYVELPNVRPVPTALIVALEMFQRLTTPAVLQALMTLSRRLRRQQRPRSKRRQQSQSRRWQRLPSRRRQRPQSRRRTRRLPQQPAALHRALLWSATTRKGSTSPTPTCKEPGYIREVRRRLAYKASRLFSQLSLLFVSLFPGAEDRRSNDELLDEPRQSLIRDPGAPRLCASYYLS